MQVSNASAVELSIDSVRLFACEAMTACEKSGQWFPALRILVTPQATVGKCGQSCAIVLSFC